MYRFIFLHAQEIIFELCCSYGEIIKLTSKKSFGDVSSEFEKWDANDVTPRNASVDNRNVETCEP